MLSFKLEIILKVVQVARNCSCFTGLLNDNGQGLVALRSAALIDLKRVSDSFASLEMPVVALCGW